MVSISLTYSGTGHGVGAALNVHEGPQSISYRYGNMTPLLEGMIVSNEPGYYEDHAFGIRIEVCTFSHSFIPWEFNSASNSWIVYHLRLQWINWLCFFDLNPMFS